MKTTEFDVTGMVCDACANRVEKALAAVPGVQTVQVDLAEGRVRAEHQEVDHQTLIAAAAAAGYRAEVLREVS